jgi:hypothetical protein
MSTRTREHALRSLELPDPFEDLTGLIGSDLRVISRALAERAASRLLLSRRQTHELQRRLWNNLTQAINDTMESLTIERH